MKLRKIVVDGVRGLPDREIDLRDARGAAARLVVVTGPSASGKTSLLDAIVAGKERVGAYGAIPGPAVVVRAGEDAAKIKLDWELSSLECNRYGLTDAVIHSEVLFGEDLIVSSPQHPALEALLSDYDAGQEFGKVEYFHSSRRLPIGSSIDLSKAPGSKSDAMTRLERSDAKYAGLIRFVVQAGLGLDTDVDGTPKPPGRVKEAFEGLCCTKRLGGLYQVDGAVLPGFFSSDGSTCGLAQLSDSELEAFLFAVTYVRSGLLQSRAGSLVLVDTPEKHLGDEDAARFVGALQAMGEENQLVVATRSRAVAASAQVLVELG